MRIPLRLSTPGVNFFAFACNRLDASVLRIDQMRLKMRRLLAVATDNRHDISTLLFAIAGIAGLIGVHFHAVGWGDGFEMVKIAQNMVDHGTFGNPFGVLLTGPTAANPPAYPLLLAVFIKILRQPSYVVLVALSGSILANAATAAMLPYVSFRWFGDAISGYIASVLWIGAMQPYPSWDTNYTVAGLLAFCLLTASDMEKSGSFVRRALIAGIVAGCVFLLNPSTALIMLPWLLYLYLTKRKANSRSALKYCFVLLVAFSILPFAWAARNYRQFGSFVIRTNLGMTLYVSNIDCAQSTLIKDESNNCYQEHHLASEPLPSSDARSNEGILVPA